jgi:two-component system, chemotaxis family, response regulator PixG
MIAIAPNNTALSTVDLLQDLASRKACGVLIASANGISWFIYFNDGKIIYANFSVDPLDRLERYTSKVLRFNQQNIDENIFKKLRQDTIDLSLNDYFPSYDYQALYSLACRKYFSEKDFGRIVGKITKEAMVSFILLTTFSFEFVPDTRRFPILWSTDFLSLVQECRNELVDWQSLRSKISSPYQRPFLVASHQDQNKYKYLEKFLVGLDFNHLSLHLNRPAIRIAQSLDLLIVDGVVGLYPPNSQYAKLPGIVNNPGSSFEAINTNQYKIICIDDSPATLQRMDDFLDSTYFQTFPVQDPLAALGKIINIKPHIILMDIDMPSINGYKLCTMVRRNQQFQNTPIIMVTSNSGMIDRARAKFCGATDYLTKPFTQNLLNEMVFQYL